MTMTARDVEVIAARYFEGWAARDPDAIFAMTHQAYTVPRGVLHRTRAPKRTAILMVEAAGVEPIGD